MSRPNRRGSNRRRKRKSPVDTFWSDGGYVPREDPQVHPTPDPAALPRSLGDVPLARETAADAHLAAVYEEAVRTATALAAANGLLATDD